MNEEERFKSSVSDFLATADLSVQRLYEGMDKIADAINNLADAIRSNAVD